MKNYMWLVFLVAAVPGNALPNKPAYLQRDSKNRDEDYVVHFPGSKEVKGNEATNATKKWTPATNVTIDERNLFKVRSNCNAGERMDKAGRCREVFK